MAARGDTRTTLALILIALVTLAYMYAQQQYRQRLKPPEPPRPAAEPPQEAVEEAPPSAEPATPPEATAQVPSPAPEAPEELAPEPAVPAPAPAGEAQPATRAVDEPQVEEQFTFEPPGGKVRLLLSTRGGQVMRAWLLNHRTSHNDDRPLEVLSALEEVGSLLVSSEGNGGPPLDAVNYRYEKDPAGREVVFRCTFADGLVVTKRYSAPPADAEGVAGHHVLLDVTLTNNGAAEAKMAYALTSAARIVPEYFDRNYVEGLVATRDPAKGTISVDRTSPRKAVESPQIVEDNVNRPIVWVGSANKYFAALLAPQAERERAGGWIAEARVQGLDDVDPVLRPDGTVKSYHDNVVVSLVTRPIRLAPGAAVTHRYLFYLGPKDRKLLAQVPEYRPFQNVITYGWFEWFSSVLLALLDLFHRLIPNYGVAIILLTLTVRLALHPLTRKSQVSMYKMQRLQPEIKKLQEKYKSDRQRLAKEQMELFRREGVNPMGGCWPMLLQLPIIIGLFRAVQLSVDLRGAPFVLWIHDLSRPDTVGYILGRPVNVLPLFMLASWIGQQALMPKPPDPQQAKQQRLMMIMTTAMFGIFFYSIASGVVLYWLTSTLVGIIEQRLIRRSLAQHDETPGRRAPAGGSSGKRKGAT